jgi:hypothetical protein
LTACIKGKKIEDTFVVTVWQNAAWEKVQDNHGRWRLAGYCSYMSELSVIGAYEFGGRT